MACPCTGSSDCMRAYIVDETLYVDPIIDPDSNLLACGTAGLRSVLSQANASVAVIDLGNGELQVGLQLDPAADNAITNEAGGAYSAQYPAQVFSAQIAGSAAVPIIGTPSGQVGPTLYLAVTNPSTTRSARVLGVQLSSSEQVAIGQGGIWSFYTETNIDGGPFAQVGVTRYDTRFPFDGGITALRLAAGGHMIPFTGTLVPGGTVTLGIRKSLTVDDACVGAASIEDTGSLDLRAILVAT